jgi:hypothetical protein
MHLRRRHKDLSPTSAERFVKWESFIKMDTGGLKDNGLDAVNCTHGQCHLSAGKWLHQRKELGGYGYTVGLCSVKDQMLKMPGVET